MPLSKQRKESMYKYAKENLKRIPLDVQKEKYEEIKSHANSHKESVKRTESVLNKGAKRIALLFNPPPVLFLEIM